MFLISFINRDMIIGNGNPNINLYTLITMVLVKTCQNLSSEKRYSKCLNPTQGLAIIPLMILKSLKAILAPNIGI